MATSAGVEPADELGAQAGKVLRPVGRGDCEPKGVTARLRETCGDGTTEVPNLKAFPTA